MSCQHVVCEQIKMEDEKRDAYSGVSDDRIRDVGEYSPDVAHAPAELLGTACRRENVALSCVQTANEGANARA